MTARNADNRFPAATVVADASGSETSRATGIAIAAVAVVGGTAILAIVAGDRLLGSLAIGATVLAAAALMQGRHLLARIQATANRQAVRAAELDSLLSSVPGAHVVLDADPADKPLTPALAALLGIEAAPVTRDHVIAACAGDDDLARALDRLVGDGKGFTREVTCPATGRRLRIHGRWLGGRDMAPATALWFEDVSDEAATVAALEVEATRLRAILDAIPVPVWQRRRDLALSYCNQAYAKVVERDVATAIAAGGELVAEMEQAEARALADRAMAAGESLSADHHVVVEGERRLLNVNESPVANGGGTVGIAWDRTDLEAATRDLERVVAGHAEALERLTTAIAIFGPDKQLKFFNSAYAQLWRLDPDWLRGEPLQGEILEALRARRRIPEVPDFPAYKKKRDAFFTALIDPLEEVVHLPDGKTLRTLISPHPFGGLMFAYEDVTDALALERSLNTLIAVQRATLDNLYEGVAVFGSDGRLKLSNPGFARLWRLASERVEGEPHIAEVVEATRDLYDPAGDWETLKAGIIAHTTDRTPRFDRLERRDGSVLEWASVPLPDGATLMTYLDVTDSIKVERALRERNEALEEADRLKSEFIANVSYELRTPLNTIIGFSELLDTGFFGALNERQGEYVTGILDSSHQLLQLINDILDLASIEAGQMQLNVASFDLDAVLASMLTLTHQRIRSENVELEFDCPGNLGEMIGDERRIKQVVFHLLSNAIHYSPPGGKVLLEGRRDGDVITIAVVDSGSGIAPEDQSRVFDKFWRGDKSTTRRCSGLGLSLVKSFVELHGGEIAIESAPSAGTRVTCRLPVDARAQRRQMTAAD